SGGSAAPPLGFGQGVLLLWLNPKAWAMAFGAAGSFAGLTEEPGTLAVAFALAFGGAALVSMLLWCALGALLARALSAPWHWRVVNGTLAVLLVASILPLWLPL
ncbi:MAG: LysE family transporter, partial [Caenispirillum bisanense]|nr:LysE family transporter [Caenispirillum bisanense]MCA1973204.1 LysE family transporter [Caenispirillum sp.]